MVSHFWDHTSMEGEVMAFQPVNSTSSSPTLWSTNITMENHHLQWVNPL